MFKSEESVAGVCNKTVFNFLRFKGCSVHLSERVFANRGMLHNATDESRGKVELFMKAIH